MRKAKVTMLLSGLLLLASGCNYGDLTNLQTQNQKLQQQLNTFDSQQRCSDMAVKTFDSNGYKFSDGYDYKNHFNSKLNKCFILISASDLNTDTLLIDLYDVLERKHYASYIGHGNCGTPLLGGGNPNKCQLDSGNIWYDGNDTKNPADYHVGFQGIAVGPGVGDENTQKQFLEHIQPFMND